MRDYLPTSPTTNSRAAAELAAAAELLRAAAPLPPMMVMYTPANDWRLELAPEQTVAASRQQVAVQRLAARMGSDVVRSRTDPPWTRGTWHEIGVFASAHPRTGDHVGHGDTRAHATLLDELGEWVHQLAEAGAEQIWIHQPRILALHPDHRLRVSVHADPDLAARLATMDDVHGRRPGQGAWAGSALTPTGHDVTIIRT